MFYSRLYRSIIALCRIGTGVAFAIQIVAVLLQVFARSFLAGSPVWTEELTRYALLFMAAFGVGLSLRNGELVHVDLISALLPQPLQRVMLFGSALITAGFCLALLAPALKFVAIGKLQTSPAMGLRMDLVHLSVFVLLVILGLFAVRRMLGVVFGVCDAEAEECSRTIP